ncbi:MAG: DUF2226 domain-containing protein [Candidatus Micrarchaeota archaeon]
MNLPPGIPVKVGIDTAAIDFPSLLKELKDKVFNGYLAITIEGSSGIEEGIVVFDNGKIVASFYDYFKYAKQIMGDLAFQRVMNAAAARHGISDIFQLTNDQVQLILAFNEQAICLPSDADIKKLKSETFSALFEEQVKEGDGSGSKIEIMKKFKLGDVEKKEKPQGETDDADDFLRDLFKGKGQ